ncbi:chromosomal replication initiator protein DnaA [Campylobacter helveticus]|uniref:Chromosomal replication initiator protein DnaA n=1 Tax=Campylobacter helveticus TaxID=28898 RepID=A0AAX2UL13_9BACT|nr:chromosomal replication initiator protein DnaA [Campylobacter helveticus]MCR2040273.1 chromosomal replication initiator protein DnaA [Campylobacter helveticus]MCR2064647.1 chromosomal replication initiator protein DnaA [Campylobacter helveticus]MCR2066286.1 chromosomal replication initiator protein DnaA [Campylobacter helveticus]TNB57390.1 chromosomal replication initiator protein DnaA [Campylobacter helveticus]TNB60068.1 chromosomal replication initiator protein DnaA [Campylobacter helveti
MDASEILDAFKKKLREEEYKNYISLLKFNEKQSKADILVFNAPNEFLAKFIQTKYAEGIALTYETMSGNKAKILIQSQTHKSKNSTKIDIAQIKMQSTILNPSFTFESFVVGGSNEYAYATCKAVSQKDKLGKLYNPIFIYGPTGLGKTHLLQAVGNVCLEMGKRVIYATSENFINDFNSHIINKTMDKFQEKYQNCDVLLIDDVQFLGKTDKIQEKFFFIFNEIRDKSGQIIMTSDNPPNMLKGITDRLKSRFANGIIADITPPQLETKIAIIRKKCEFNEVNLNNEIISYLATAMGDNIREIEGMITNLNAYSRLINQEISLEFAKEMMKDHIKEKKENITIEDILSIVSKEFNLKTNDIKSTKRSQNIVLARRIIIFLARELTSLSMPQLAVYFEMKDHTAISHNIKKINELIKEDQHLKSKIEELKNKILTKSQS